MKEKLKIQQALQKWFVKNKRNLPWRKNRSWYRVWISEIMLQQTQVKQAINYYNNFLHRFPNINSLANADLQDVLKSWEGMGYYSRAHNLHKTAKIIVDQYNGRFPSERDEIIRLPGIGEYTAHALLSFVYNQPYSVVDGNVIRVLTRLFAIADNIRESKVVRDIKLKAQMLLPVENSAVFNEALMELGALVCLPKNPNCLDCPLNIFCRANQNNLTNIIPIKSPPKIKPQVTAIAQIIIHNDKYLVVKRKNNGLLGGYWEFPLEYFTNSERLDSLNESVKFNKIFHSYTHFNLEVTPIITDRNKSNINNELYAEKKWMHLKEIRKLPIHKAMNKVLDSVDNN